jgi:hypothetical protein
MHSCPKARGCLLITGAATPWLPTIPAEGNFKPLCCRVLPAFPDNHALLYSSLLFLYRAVEQRGLDHGEPAGEDQISNKNPETCATTIVNALVWE